MKVYKILCLFGRWLRFGLWWMTWWLGAGKFESLWLGPYILQWVLNKGAYELVDVCFLFVAWIVFHPIIFFKQQKKDNKLAPKYYGPYKVLQKIGSMAYKLELPPSSRIHPVFHVSCLKKVIGENIPVQTMLPELDEEGKFILEPEAVIETRTKKLRNRAITEYLI